VVEGQATLEALDTHYSLSDVLNHNDALDLKQEAERLAQERAAEEMRNGRGR
jgi:hypothetical protein